MPIINQVVAGSGGGSSVAEPYLEYDIDNSGNLIHKNTSRIIDLTGVKTINIAYAFFEAYQGNTNISGVADLHTIETVSNVSTCQKMFSSTNISGINLSVLTTVSGQDCMRSMCYNCQNITNVVLPELKTISGRNGFSGFLSNCSNLVSVSIPKLETISGSSGLSSLFYYSNGLTTFYFESLKNITASYALQQEFEKHTTLQSVWFYALTPSSFGSQTTQFNNMLKQTSGVTVHFPMAIQSTIGSWSDVTNGFGGTNTTVLFDIVTSLTGADGNTYTRQEKDSTTTATAWVYNDTLYYTSGVSDNDNGVNEPAVSDAIYSDAACTQSVTTITAIA